MNHSNVADATNLHQTLCIVAKCSILDVCGSPRYSSFFISIRGKILEYSFHKLKHILASLSVKQFLYFGTCFDVLLSDILSSIMNPKEMTL